MSLHLDVPDRLPHDPADDVPQTQRLRDHLHLYPQNVPFTVRRSC
jgi:hypothetical protein